MWGGALTAAAPRLSTLLFLLAATTGVCRGGRQVGPFREAGSSPSGRTAQWTASPVTGDERGSRCAAICETDRRRGGGGTGDGGQLKTTWGKTPEEEECAVDLDFSDFAEHARVLGVELDVGFGAAPPDTLRVYGLDEGLDFNYHIYKQERRKRIGDGSSQSRTEKDEETYTVSVRISAATSEPFRPGSVTLRLEACGLGLKSVMGRGASVFVLEPDGSGGGDGGSQAAPQGGARRSGLQHLFGILPTYLPGRRGLGHGDQDQAERGQPRPLTARGLRTSAIARTLSPGRTPAVSVSLKHTGTGAAAAAAGTGGGRRRLAEDCSADCLTSTTERCQNNPETCETGGIGCNAQNDQLCQFCNLGEPYVECSEDLPTPSPGPTPSPTFAPNYVECSSRCLESVQYPCFDDPTCSSGDNIGCNATGDFYCRFCNFLPEFQECPAGFPTAAPTPAPSVVSTVVPSAAPSLTTSVPTAAPSISTSVTPTSAPTVAGTASPTNLSEAPTAAPTSSGPSSPPTPAPTVAVGALGPASVKGSITAFGVPDELVEEKGEELLIQEAVCGFSSCVGGVESVVVGGSAVARARALLPSSNGQVRPPVWRRRLADLVGVEFEKLTPTAASSEVGGEPLTGSKQAAALINQISNSTARTAVAETLGIDAEDLEFNDLAYFEGTEFEFTVTSEFGTVGEETEASTGATVLAAITLVAAMLLCCCCVFCLMVNHGTDKRRAGREGRASRSPPRKSASVREKLSTIDEERGFQLEQKEVRASHFMGPTAESALNDLSFQDYTDDESESSKGQPRPVNTHSIRSDGSSLVSEKFTYTNPMHMDGEAKRTSPPNEYSDDLAQHYEGDKEDEMSDVSLSKTNNPLFTSMSNRVGASSPASTAEATRARNSAQASSDAAGLGANESFSSGSDSASSASWLSGTTEEMGTDHGGDARGSSFDGGGGGYKSHGNYRRGGSASMSVFSETSSRNPFGLSPVAEVTGDRGESLELTTNSSSTTGGASTIYHARGSGGPDSGMPGSFNGQSVAAGGGFGSEGGRGGGAFSVLSSAVEDDDAESMFRPLSPGSVTRPLQPLLAQHSPLSSASAFDSKSNSFAMSSRSNSNVQLSPPTSSSAFESESTSFSTPSRSNSLLSPKNDHAAMGAPGAGLQKGISSGSLKAIKVAGGDVGEHEAIRKTVRSQRRKLAHSMSQEQLEDSSNTGPAERQQELGRFGNNSRASPASTTASSVAQGLADRRLQYESSESELKFVRGRESSEAASRVDSASDPRLTSGSQSSSSHREALSDFSLATGTPDRALKPAVGGEMVQHRNAGSHASADAAGGRGDASSSPGARTPDLAREAANAEEEDTEDDQGDEFYDAASTAKGDRVMDAAASIAAAAVAAARGTGLKSGKDGAGGSASLRFSSHARALNRQAAGGGGGGGGGGAKAAEAAKNAKSMPAKGLSSSLSLSKSSSEFDSPRSATSTEASILAAKECHDRAVEAGTAAAGAAVASGRTSTEAQLMAAGAVAAAKATKGRAVPDDVRRKAIQAGAKAAAAAAVAERSSSDVNRSGRWSSNTSGIEVKSVLKSPGRGLRNSDRPLSVSFAHSSDDDARVDDSGVVRGGGLRQHLADPSMPLGSYRHPLSDDPSSFSDESLSPSHQSAMTGDAYSYAPSSDTHSIITAQSFATDTSVSTTLGTNRAAGLYNSEQSSHSRYESESKSDSDADSGADWPSLVVGNTGAARAQEREAARDAGRGRRERSGHAAAAAAAALTPEDVGATTTAAATASERRSSTVAARNNMFSRNSSSRSSSGESKRRMVMR